MRWLAVVLVLILLGCVQHHTIHVLAGKGLKADLLTKAEEFSKSYGIKVNLTFTSYTNMKDFGKYDVVIAPKEFPLFNITLNVNAVKVLPYKVRVPVVVVRPNSTIKSIEDLNGKTVVLIGEHVPGRCIGIKILKAYRIRAHVIYNSPKRIFEDVAMGKADATIVWNDTVKGNFRLIPIRNYEMRIYILVIKNGDAVEKFVKFLVGG